MTLYSRRQFLSAGFAGLTASCLSCVPGTNPRPMNVLFIAVDDLRPTLGCYGNTTVVSPNIDRLAARGTTFRRAYCQMPICSPSRTSLLTGLRPDTNGITDMATHFRELVPDVVALPEHYRLQGWHTCGLGKIYHGGKDDAQSWSVPHWDRHPRYLDDDSQRIVTMLRQQKMNGGNVWKNGPPWEAPVVEDSITCDGQICERAVETLREIKNRPFFLAVGFHKPHLPFSAPKRYWDLYNPDNISLAANPGDLQDTPQVALENWTAIRNTELRQYYGIPKEGPVSTDTVARNLIHGYYACVSMIDAQVGCLMAELERLKLADKTIVVLWGDHGFHLGEHGAWAKHTNFEESTRCPLIVHMPGQAAAGQPCSALVELVDIYPSLCTLAGLPLPDGLEGVSFAPLLDDQEIPWKTAAFSQISRSNMGGHGRGMGYTIRTDRYRFNRWTMPGTEFREVELYDHRVDPGENVNLARRPEYADLAETMEQRLDAGWRSAMSPG